MKALIVWLIVLYQKAFSRFFGKGCRFYPTCSEYTRQAVEKHGMLKGLKLGAARIVRCHPWHPGGIDPVP